jgi:hypothetical protein
VIPYYATAPIPYYRTDTLYPHPTVFALGSRVNSVPAK